MESLGEPMTVDEERYLRWNNTLAFAISVYGDFVRALKEGTSLLDAVQSLTKDKEELSSHLRNHGITEEDVVLDYSEAEDKDNAYYPRFALFFHHATESLVLAVRGTSSIKDAISDLMADEVPFLGGFAHRGIVRCADRVIELAGNHITEALKKQPGYRLMLTGHSLGGGVVNILGLMFLEGEAKKLLLPDTKVKVNAFAPPPVFHTENQYQLARVKESIHIYIHDSDIVPRLSLATVAQFLATIHNVDALDLTKHTKLAILKDSRGRVCKGGRGHPGVNSGRVS